MRDLRTAVPPQSAVTQAFYVFFRVVAVAVAAPFCGRQRPAPFSLPEPIGRESQQAGRLGDAVNAVLRLHAPRVGGARLPYYRICLGEKNAGGEHTMSSCGLLRVLAPLHGLEFRGR